MGLNLNKLDPELAAKFREMTKDGQITAEEWNSLTEDEQEKLSAGLGGKVPTAGDAIQIKQFSNGKEVKSTSNTKEVATTKGTKTEKKNWFSKVKDWFSDPEVKTWKKVAAGVAGVAAAAATGIAIAVGGLPWAVVGAIAGAGILSSCTYEETINNSAVGSASVKFEQSVSDADSTEKILAALEKLGIYINNNTDSVNEAVATMKDSNKSIAQILAVLTTAGVNIDKIVSAMEEQGVKMDMVVEQLSTLNGKVDSGIKDVLTDILKEVKTGNQLATNNNDILNKVLVAIQNLPQGTDAEAVKALLQQILEQVREGVNDNKDMTTKTHDMLGTIIDKLDSINSTNKDFYAKLLDKIDNIEASNTVTQGMIQTIIDNLGNVNSTNQDFYNILLEKIDDLSSLGNASLEKILKAINANTSVAQNTRCLVQEILNNLGKLGNKADDILAAIGNISSGDKVDLTKIETMLEQILAQSKSNGDVLTSIDSKLGLVSVTLNGIKQQIGSNHTELLAKLDKIIAKIPDGCNCKEVDLTVIINKLDTLIESVKQNPNDDTKHEGILDDLDSILG